MKAFFKASVVILSMIIVVFFAIIMEYSGYHKNEQTINNWKIAWTDHRDLNMHKAELEKFGGWFEVNKDNPILERPKGAESQWIEIELPKLTEMSSGILFDKVYGKHIVINIEEEQVYESHRNYNYEINSILVPLKKEDSNKKVYIGIQSERRIGIPDVIRIGEYQDLMKGFVKENSTDFILGSTVIFIAFIMLICSLFLKKTNLGIWMCLCLIMISCGIIILTYSSFLYWLFESVGDKFVTLFEISLLTLLPSFTFFFEKIFGEGKFSLIKKSRKFQVYYSVICLTFFFINVLMNNQLYPIYRIFSITIIGFIMITQFFLLVIISTVYSFRGNREAIIFSTGFLIFATLSLSELVWFYSNSAYYDLFLWKWGLVSFITSLIMILARRFSENHEQVVEYSKQLEMFNNELQRSEKIEIISELAASVAHEVRNPLQVTRGFIQLLAEKQNKSDKVYLNMALDELDRASGIITDFLTFAKPEVGKVTTINLLKEFIHIEGILLPLANLQGGKITVHIPKELYIYGNSSKFKQAFVNIIKNSIEALKEEGDIQIWAYEKNGKISIHIKDNGEGMEPEVLSRLGEPYFSNKTKGTGLGLMVTFKIIEVMSGSISFFSEKGSGTEAIIIFPSVAAPES